MVLKEKNNRIIAGIYLALVFMYFIASVSPLWHLMPPFEVLMVVTALIAIQYKSFGNTLLKNLLPIIVFSSLFWINLIGVTYSENKTDTWVYVLLKFSLLLFAFHFATWPETFSNQKLIKRIINGFVYIVFGGALFCIAMAMVHYFDASDIQQFYYTGLCYFQHPSYMGLSVNLAILFIIVKWSNNEPKDLRNNGIFYFLILPVLILFLILLQSKAAILSFLMIVFLAFLYQFLKLKNFIGALKMLIYISMLSFIIAVLVPNSINRFYSVQKAISEQNNETGNKESTAARIELWKGAIYTIKQSPVFGFGTGDASTVYNKNLREIGFLDENDVNYDSHSQFLQTYMKTGFLGFLMLIISLFYPLYISFKRNNFLYFAFSAMLVFNLLVESMFERQAGLMFYAFFNSFFYFLNVDGRVTTSEN